ncbi:DUF2235 domain-containing protein [Modestobacter excelsi]|uniref:DUF2235 domain-containing protein n=1 Tax=Modestobacter excelsi TaxID=2213161 RepID=UPI001C20EE69|nr:DUF2235 domain-containing protein [Modestobacter excelsi]
MRHLVVCCDGTWQTARNRTNVRRLADALAPAGADGTEQVCRYFTGVGTDGSLLAQVTGGVAGEGLSGKVIEAYIWTATAYQEGDRISLFGFSRGAYTVRSLLGLISACGLLDLSDLPAKEARTLVQRVYDEKYRARDEARPDWRRGARFRFDAADEAEIPVSFIGVWDTVGSLGIPDHLGLVNLLDSPRRYEFHDVTLNPHVPHARHAIALDEFRGPFTPTLWAGPAPGQDIRQVWFPGDHGDVGGGHRETGLSEGALVWMAQEATAAVGLGFSKVGIDDVRPNPSDRIHGDARSVPGPAGAVADALFQPRPRAVPLLDPADPTDPSIHESAYRRQRDRQLPGGPYRPTRRLAPGGSGSVDVSAAEPWNATGLYVEADRYRFTAEGRWRSGTFQTGPAGATGGQLLHWRALGQLAGTLVGGAESLYRWLSGNRAADFYGAPRESTRPWMSLVGVVANEVPALPPQQARPHEQLPIGAGVEHEVTRPGYLYAFANDAWGFYGNNSGSVRLTVTRA